MKATGKLRITFSENNTEGCFSEQNRAVLANAIMQVIEHANFSTLELHVVMPADDVEDMLDGIQQAGVDLQLDEVPTAGEIN